MCTCLGSYSPPPTAEATYPQPQAKNVEVQHAVDDLIRALTAYGLDPRVGRVSEEELLRLRRHYNHFMFQVRCVCRVHCVYVSPCAYIFTTSNQHRSAPPTANTHTQALLHCAKNSMDALKKRIAPRSLLHPTTATGGCVHTLPIKRHLPKYASHTHTHTPKQQQQPAPAPAATAALRAALLRGERPPDRALRGAAALPRRDPGLHQPVRAGHPPLLHQGACAVYIYV